MVLYIPKVQKMKYPYPLSLITAYGINLALKNGWGMCRLADRKNKKEKSA